jgi:hypothetical protein
MISTGSVMARSLAHAHGDRKKRWSDSGATGGRRSSGNLVCQGLAGLFQIPIADRSDKGA